MTKIIYILLIIIISNCGLYSQKPEEKTYQIWLENKFKFEVADNFDIELSHDLRYDLTNEIIENSFTEIGSAYEFLDYFKISAALRIIENQPDWLTEYSAYFQFQIPINDFTVKLRTRYQNKDNIYRLKEVLREKLTLDYDFMENSAIGVSGEIFYETGIERIDKARYCVEVSNKIAKVFKLTLGYIFETQFNRKSPKIDDILLLNLSIKVM